MPKFHLLTPANGNPKTVKGESLNYQTYILHLSPGNLSGYEVCQHRTKGCTLLCLNLAGRGGIFNPGQTTNLIQECRKRRTRLFFEDRTTFLSQLVEDIAHAIRYARSKGLTAVFRLNGTSDIPWENIPISYNDKRYPNLFAIFPETQFYDYTKAPYAMRRHDIPNYHLTFSYAETLKNQLSAREWYQNGHSVSVVFGLKKTASLPAVFRGAPVYNADETDLRFLDKHGIAGLHAKGNAWKHNPNGFII